MDLDIVWRVENDILEMQSEEYDSGAYYFHVQIIEDYIMQHILSIRPDIRDRAFRYDERAAEMAARYCLAGTKFTRAQMYLRGLLGRDG